MARPRKTEAEREVVRRHFFEVYERYGRDKVATARALGVAEKTVYNRLHAYAAEGVEGADDVEAETEALCDECHARRYAR